MAKLETLLRQNRVLFVGSSLQDPRLLRYLAGLDNAARASLQRWVAILGPVVRPSSSSVAGRMAWKVANKVRRIDYAIQIGPVYMECLIASGKNDSAQRILPALKKMLMQLPEDDPVRVGALQQFGIGE